MRSLGVLGWVGVFVLALAAVEATLGPAATVCPVGSGDAGCPLLSTPAQSYANAAFLVAAAVLWLALDRVLVSDVR